MQIHTQIKNGWIWFMWSGFHKKLEFDSRGLDKLVKVNNNCIIRSNVMPHLSNSSELYNGKTMILNMIASHNSLMYNQWLNSVCKGFDLVLP